jgi:NADH-quinone oxidoreductase subunit L
VSSLAASDLAASGLAAHAQETVPVITPAAASGVFSLLWVIVALPALGATVLLLLGDRRT